MIIKIDEFLDFNVDTFAIGHESCPHQLLNIDNIDEIFGIIETKGIYVKLQVTITYQRSF